MKYTIIIVNRKFLAVLLLLGLGFYGVKHLCNYYYNKGMTDLVEYLRQQQGPPVDNSL